MSRMVTGDGQEIIFEDLNRISQLIEREIYERVIYHLIDKNTGGFFQDSFYVDYSDATHVSVRAGSGFQLDATAVDPETTARLLYNPTASVKAITAPDATNPRVDIVVVKADRAVTDTESRQVKDFTTSVVAPQVVTVETDWLATITVVAGTPAGSPVAPAVPTGYVKIATLAVAANTGMSSQASVTDNRTKLPILDLTKIDTSDFVYVPSKAVGTSLKQVLSELDALAIAASQTLLAYNAIVGSTAGCTHATLAAAYAAVSAGAKILLTENITMNSTLTVAKDNIEIEAKPGVVISKGSATTGFSITSPGFKFHGGKVSGFSGSGDKAFVTSALATYCMIWGTRFASNDTDIDDALAAVAAWGNVNE